jgi:hypothetical protein
VLVASVFASNIITMVRILCYSSNPAAQLLSRRR